MPNAYSRRDLALNDWMNPLSTKKAVRDMIARGEIKRATRWSLLSDRMDAWCERHPLLTALMAFPLFWGLMIGIASL